MANQHTKKKEKLAAAAAKKATNAYKKTQKDTAPKAETAKPEAPKPENPQSAGRGNREAPKVEVHMLDMGDFFAQRRKAFEEAAKKERADKFPLLSKCEDKQKRTNQPFFMLLACDNLVPVILNQYIELAMQMKVPHRKVAEAEALLEAINDWRKEHPLECKTPD